MEEKKREIFASINFLLYLCSRIPFHSAWERKFFSSRRGYVPCCGRDTGHNKRRLKRFVLAIRNLVNSSICQNIAAKDAHWYVINARAYCAHLYIRRGLQCCLFYRLGNTRASNSGTARLQSRFFVCT